MGFVLEVLIVAIGLSAAMGVAWLVAETNGTLGMDRRDLDLCDGACRLCPRAVAGFARSFATIPRRRPRGLWSLRLGFHIVQSHGAGRRRPAL